MSELVAPVMFSPRSSGWGMIMGTHTPSVCSQNNLTLIKGRRERLKVVLLKLIRGIYMVQDPHSPDEKKPLTTERLHVDVITSL